MDLLPKSYLLVSCDHISQSHLKFQSCLTTEYAGVCFWMNEENFPWNHPWSTWGCLILHFFLTFLQFSSCGPWRVFGHSNSPPHHALGRYRHPSSSSQVCNIFSWLETLMYCPDGGNGDLQCFNSFLTATFYVVMLNNLVLHIRTIFLGFTPCDGWLREFSLYVPHIYNPVDQEVMAGQLHAPSHPGSVVIYA